MNTRVRAVADEGLGPRIAEALEKAVTLRKPRSQVTSLFTYVDAGAADEDWVPLVARTGGIVLSADRGRGRQAGGRQPLPKVCRAHGVPLVMAGNSITKAGAFEIALAFLRCWDRIAEEASRGFPHICYIIERKGLGVRFRPQTQSSHPRFEVQDDQVRLERHEPPADRGGDLRQEN